jgi:hypothetical protein
MKTILFAALVVPVVLSTSSLASAAEWGALELLGGRTEPGTKSQLTFVAQRSFSRDTLDTDVFVVRGAKPGPTLCLIAAVHGDEINGVEIARHSSAESDPATLSGTLISIPIVNVWGFRSGNRMLPDRRDLNRGFPGNRTGSTASQTAFNLFDRVIRHCEFLVDLHTGSNDRSNLPQIRVDLDNEGARGLALAFNVGVVLGGSGPLGSLRRSAVDAGIPAIIYESGGPNRFEKHEIAQGIAGVQSVMKHLRMLEGAPPKPDPQRIYRNTSWVRSPGGGIFLTERSLGEEIAQGDLLGTVTDPHSSVRVEILAPFPGTLIGMANPTVVLPGFGLFHLGRSGEVIAPEPRTPTDQDLEPDGE